MSAPPSQPLHPDEPLLEQLAWMRALARRLVADAQTADDLTQDACVAALERSGGGGRPRAWLQTVVRNLHRQVARSRANRAAREAIAARAEAQPGAHDVLERAALQREVYEAVMALSEPNRTVVLLRYFDGLPQRKIAARLGVPVATVHSRLRRGLAELRERLETSRGGDPRALAIALLPLAEQAAPWGPWRLLEPRALGAPLGALVMDAKVKVAVGVVLAACGVLGLWRWVGEPDATSTRAAVRGAAEVLAQVEGDDDALEAPVGPGTTSERRVEAPAELLPPAVPAVAASAAAPIRVRGRVLDAHAAPVSGIRIAFRASADERAFAASARAPEPIATSDAGGAFELLLEPGARLGELVAAEPALATLMTGLWRAGSIYEPVIAVAPACALAGRVVDADGAPIADATLALHLDEAFEARFAEVLDASQRATWRARSDEAGRFELLRAPAVEGARLMTTREGFLPDVRELPGRSDPALAIVLERPRVDDGMLSGVVLDERGDPVAGARVLLAPASTTTDRDGLFALELSSGSASVLRALKPGRLPAELAASPPDERGRVWPAFVTLRLGGPTLALAGAVVDEHGRALEGVRVWLADSTYVGHVEDVPAQMENVLAGSRSRAELEREEERRPELRGRDVPSLFWTWAETDREGRFRIEGLLARSYRLKAMDAATLALIEDGPFAAGADDVRLVLPMGEGRRVAGRVVTRRGRPVEGVRVTVGRTTMAVTYATEHGTARSSRGMPGASTTTDADGRFELDGVPPAGVFVQFAGDAILPDHRDLDAVSDPTALEVVVAARCHVQVELDGPTDRADRVEILDADGARLQLSILRGEDEESGPSMPLAEGRSVVIAVAETAATLVLLRGGEEVERHPITLVEGTVNVLRL